jgi:hypothetical protein
MSATPCKMRSPPICPWSDLRNSTERSNLRLFMHNRWREVVAHNSASAALECSKTRWRTQGQRRRITARVSAAGETGSDNPNGQRLTALLPFPQAVPFPRLCHALLLPSCSEHPSSADAPTASRYGALAMSSSKNFLIDPIVHISILNDNLPSRRLIIFQHFGVHLRPEGFIQWEVSPFVTFERKS